MNNKGLLYFILGSVSLIGGVVLLSVKDAADRHLSDEVGRDLAKHNNDYISLQDEYNNAKENVKIAKNITEKENQLINNRINDYKKSIQYDEKIASITREIWKKTEDFKDSISYSAEKEKIEKELNEAISKVKETMDYDKKISSQKRLIEDANRAYERQTLFMENNEASNAAKKAARKARDKTIDSANEAIEELEKQLKKEVKSAKKVADERVKGLDERVASKNKEFSEAAESLREQYRNALAKKRLEIKEEVINDRTEEAANYIRNCSINESIMDSTKSRIDKVIREAMDRTTGLDAIVLYLKSCNIKAPVIAITGLFAGIPLFYICYEYVNSLVYVIRRVAE